MSLNEEVNTIDIDLELSDTSMVAASIQVGDVEPVLNGVPWVHNSGTLAHGIFDFGIPVSSITAGTVTKLAGAAAPTVTNSGTQYQAVFDFGVPVPSIQVKSTHIVEGAEPVPTVVNEGTEFELALNFGIPVSTVQINSTTTGNAGAPATVTEKGTKFQSKLDFVIPKGITFTPSIDADGNVSWTNDDVSKKTVNPTTMNVKGQKGDKGDTGEFAIGTVTTGAPGTNATVKNSGTSTNGILDFVIPRGDTGRAITNVTEDNSVNRQHTYTFDFSDNTNFKTTIYDGATEGATQVSSDPATGIKCTQDRLQAVVTGLEASDTQNGYLSSELFTKLNNLNYKYEVGAYTLLSANWINGEYTLESRFRSSLYDIQLEVDSATTAEQILALGNAQIVGKDDSNILKALGTVPTIDIPVKLIVIKKGNVRIPV